VVRTVVLTTTPTSTVVTGLTNGTAYNFRIAAVNALGTGAFSASSATVTPVGAPTVPGAPTIGVPLRGAAGGAITATATWVAPASTGGSVITGYRVSALRMAANGTTVLGTTVQNVGPAARTSTFTLAAGTYRFEVRAVNAVGAGAPSARSVLVVPR
jgi:predicted phage tail protein